jgi:hypothetical protein
MRPSNNGYGPAVTPDRQVEKEQEYGWLFMLFNREQLTRATDRP